MESIFVKTHNEDANAAQLSNVHIQAVVATLDAQY